MVSDLIGGTLKFWEIPGIAKMLQRSRSRRGLGTPPKTAHSALVCNTLALLWILVGGNESLASYPHQLALPESFPPRPSRNRPRGVLSKNGSVWHGEGIGHELTTKACTNQKLVQARPPPGAGTHALHCEPRGDYAGIPSL